MYLYRNRPSTGSTQPSRLLPLTKIQMRCQTQYKRRPSTGSTQLSHFLPLSKIQMRCQTQYKRRPSTGSTQLGHLLQFSGFQMRCQTDFKSQVGFCVRVLRHGNAAIMFRRAGLVASVACRSWKTVLRTIIRKRCVHVFFFNVCLR
jgi:hypothetical protein